MGKKLETGTNPGSIKDSKGASGINEKVLPTKSSSSFAMQTQSIFTHNREKKTYLQRFDISLEDLSQLGKNHSSAHDIRHAMITLFQTYVKNSQGAHGSGDVEDPDEMKSARSILEDIIVCLQQDEKTCESAAADANVDADANADADADADANKGALKPLTQAQKGRNGRSYGNGSCCTHDHRP